MVVETSAEANLFPPTGTRLVAKLHFLSGWDVGFYIEPESVIRAQSYSGGRVTRDKSQSENRINRKVQGGFCTAIREPDLFQFRWIIQLGGR